MRRLQLQSPAGKAWRAALSAQLVIDVSHHQGVIDWRRVAAAGVYGAIVKASDGTQNQDERFITNIFGARKAGLKTGAYHFARLADGGIQGANYLSMIHQVDGLRGLELGAWIDFEDPDDAAGMWLRTTLEGRLHIAATLLWTVDQAYASKGMARHAGIYCIPRWFASTFPSDRSGRELWAASPNGTPRLGGTCWAQTGWRIHQYDFKGRVDGISGDVDLNHLRAA